ncbi:hypothetical protein [Paenibacillus sp. Marseille-Q4541]|uniref:hypothetical protein n=1 Tax=Paenibacillus sp. Marseille-Q4541 TaxID=2831522 RepID=UPI001BA84E7B|nr:hypothetical protein [Paenibacillus sp. Marseille-Q4541]
MSKSKTTWEDVVSNAFEERKNENELLSPSKLEFKYIVDYGRIIYDKLQLMNNTSNMAHEKIIDFEKAQRIIDHQKKTLKKDIEYLKSYLEINDEK